MESVSRNVFSILYCSLKHSQHSNLQNTQLLLTYLFILFVYHFLFVAIQEMQQQKMWIAVAQVPLNSSSTESSATEMKVAFQTA